MFIILIATKVPLVSPASSFKIALANFLSDSDLDKITDDLERQATVGIIHNCSFSPVSECTVV